MNPRRGCAARPCVLGALACAPLLAAAADVPPPPTLSRLPAPVAASAPPAAARSAVRVSTAGLVRVIEDDEVRIEEHRDARGRVVRLLVTPKNGGKPYEVIVPAGGKDASQARGATGQSAWSVLNF